ncbi:uncharacterized protein [Nicotiana tomentosiformis]|uniref:uncharacterized protein n=1 Tax=Nicotiana tomentosiformis TaxID=4098 RepID=UPI00388C707F
MHATETEGVELASYRLKKVAYSWFEMWEESLEEESPPSRWSEFVDAFIDHFFPAETKAARAAEFESLKQCSMSVWEYHMRFVRFSKYAIYILPTMEARVRWFVHGLTPLVINEAATAALNSDMIYGKIVVFPQATDTRKLKNRMERDGSNKARSAGNYSGNFGGGGRSAFRGGQARATGDPTPQGRPRGKFQQRPRALCGMMGHIQRDYHSSHQSMGRGDAQLASSAATTSAAPPLA